MTGDDLRAWRERRGVTQKVVARLFACTPDAVQSWELGRRAVPEHVARMVAAIALADAVRGLLGARAGVIQRTPWGVLPAPHELVAAEAIARVEAALSAMG